MTENLILHNLYLFVELSTFSNILNSTFNTTHYTSFIEFKYMLRNYLIRKQTTNLNNYSKRWPFNNNKPWLLLVQLGHFPYIFKHTQSGYLTNFEQLCLENFILRTETEYIVDLKAVFDANYASFYRFGKLMKKRTRKISDTVSWIFFHDLLRRYAGVIRLWKAYFTSYMCCWE